MAASGPKKTVLVIEPDTDAFFVIRYHLGKAGFDVNRAIGAQECVELLRQRHIDLIVSETNLAGMTGFNLRKRLFLDPGTRDIPFLFLMEDHQSNENIQTLRHNLDDFVAKPFDPLHLIARVEAILSRKQAQEEIIRIDQLTQLLNFSALSREVAVDLERTMRYNRQAAVGLLDIDHFSEFNEKQGHAFGDLLLSCLANTIAVNVRTVDIAGRYSGGKFLLYLPETDENGAKVLVNRILGQFKEASQSLMGEEMTFCAGLVRAPEFGADFETVTVNATKALERAKGRGFSEVDVWGAES